MEGEWSPQGQPEQARAINIDWALALGAPALPETFRKTAAFVGKAAGKMQ